jgi:hypothetical protein
MALIWGLGWRSASSRATRYVFTVGWGCSSGVEMKYSGFLLWVWINELGTSLVGNHRKGLRRKRKVDSCHFAILSCEKFRPVLRFFLSSSFPPPRAGRCSAACRWPACRPCWRDRRAPSLSGASVDRSEEGSHASTWTADPRPHPGPSLVTSQYYIIRYHWSALQILSHPFAQAVYISFWTTLLPFKCSLYVLIYLLYTI